MKSLWGSSSFAQVYTAEEKTGQLSSSKTNSAVMGYSVIELKPGVLSAWNATIFREGPSAGVNRVHLLRLLKLRGQCIG